MDLVLAEVVGSVASEEGLHATLRDAQVCMFMCYGYEYVLCMCRCDVCLCVCAHLLFPIHLGRLGLAAQSDGGGSQG